MISAAGVQDEGRFQHRGELGTGGMGVVYRVHDRARGTDLALKTLKRLDANELYRFKREFRILADLEHPNLVTLHDLYDVAGEWMYTMELVDGVPFDRWVREPSLDLERLRDALYQLADGLTALHVAGRLHRDIKPSNVLVERDGRVVLLDFGLTTVLALQAVEHTHERHPVGTPAYMSPEQSQDQTLTEASDWYAVGVMLFEALTGRRPFEGNVVQVLAKKQVADAPSPRQLDPDVPDDLATLCEGLLARDPARRAGGDAVFAALGREPSAATARVASGQIRAPLVGRDAELTRLKQALYESRDHMVLALVTGPRGSGKTALLRSFVEHQQRAGAVIVPGRAVEREVIPLRALDPMVDALSGHLMRMPHDELARVVPKDMPLLAQLFPVLRRVPALNFPAFMTPTVDPNDDEILYRASLAIAALLEQVGRTRPLVVALDDMQWADEREAALIHRYEGPDAPKFLIVVAIRTGSPEADTILGHYLAFKGDLRHIELKPRA